MTADEVPVERSAHSANEYFRNLGLVGQFEAEWVLSEG